MKTWRYEPAQDLDQPLAERLRRFPREPDMTVYLLRSLAALFIRGWLRVFHRLEVTGREHLPSDGSFVMVANHASHLDALCLLAALPLRKLHRAFPAAARDHFFVDVHRLAMAAVVVNALPFGRQTHIRQSLDLCRRLLENAGNILILFPEGTRSANGEVGRFKPGIGMLVSGTRIPVIPCHLEGTFEAWSRHHKFPRPKPISLRIGRSLHFESMADDKSTAHDIADQLRQAVLALAL